MKRQAIVGNLLWAVLFVHILTGMAQDKKTYFELQGNTIAIEAENGMGYGWIESTTSSASGGKAILFPRSDTTNFPVAADTYIDYYQKSTNYGHESTLLVDGKGGLKRAFFEMPWGGYGMVAIEKASYLKFDISGLQQPIVEAKVHLYCNSGSMGGGIFALDPRMDNLNWSETQATWYNRPNTGYDGNTFQDFVGDVVPGHWQTFDVTEALFGKQNGIYGFGIVMQQDQPTSWSSKEGNHPPYLWVRTKRQGVQIAGKSYYYSNSSPIPNVSFETAGDITGMQYSDPAGNYSFLDLNSGITCDVIPSKQPDSDVGPYDITTYDAAITAQTAVGLRTLDSAQAKAADVSKDAVVSTYDAALIARYAVGLPNISGSHVGEWAFVPDSRSYINLSSDLSGQDFMGILLGNVHGGWQAKTGEEQGPLAKSLQLNDYVLNPRQEFEFPVKIPGGKNIISFDIELAYDNTVLKFEGIKRTGIGSGAEVVFCDKSGLLRLGAYQVTPFDVKKELLTMKFKVLGAPLKTSVMNVNRFLLNKDIVFRGKITLHIAGGSYLPTAYRLYQSYPNPFLLGRSQQRLSRIEFDLPQTSRVTLEVYNRLGQLVRRLVQGERGAGHYSVLWNGRNEAGQIVSSGIYFYRLEANGFRGLKRIVFLR